ncbi:hypothetical protein QR685DRAFT_299083 [Neurospora intermedia]
MRVQIPTPGYTAYMKLPAVPANIQAALAGDENQRLNLIWIGLVAVEILMVVSVVLHAVIRTVYPKKKQRLGSWKSTGKENDMEADRTSRPTSTLTT